MLYPSLPPRDVFSEREIISSYYSKRASTYDSAVRPAERCPDMEELIRMIENRFSNRKVLEVACGTGYWTQIIARSASVVKAVDINDAMIRRAATKLHGQDNVTLGTSDAYSLANINELFDIGFGGFWWSHIPKRTIPHFLSTLSRKMKDGASVIMVDNNYVDGCSGPITNMDREGNTYQTRIIDGRKYEVLKNFPTPEEIEKALRGVASESEVVSLEHYWVFFAKV